MKYLLLVCLIYTSITTSNAQQDYLISIKGDTLYGEIKLLSSTSPEQVQLIQDKKRQNFHPLQAREFTLDGNTYRSVKNYDTYQFMILLKDGFLSLYAYKMDRQSTFDGRLLVKKDGSVLDLPNIGFKRKMAAFLSDCQPVVDKVEQSEFGRNDIELIITSYNDCLNEKTALSKSPVLTSESKPSFDSAEILLVKLRQSQDFENKADAIAMVEDIKSKLQRNEKIPTYLQEGLKNILAKQESLQEPLENLISTLNN